MGRMSPNADCGDNKDAILMMHDVNQTDSDALFDSYQFWDIVGEPGARCFILGTHRMPMYLCGNTNGYATHQMVFYENTNIIEFHIQDKPLCDTWNGGYAAFGIQNTDQTLGLAMPGRDNLDQYQILDLTDGFYDTNINSNFPVNQPESWRFIPDGTSGTSPVFGWYLNWDDTAHTGTLISNDPLLTVIESDISGPTVYTAVVTYTNDVTSAIYYAVQDVVFDIDESDDCDQDGLTNTEEDATNNLDTDNDNIPNYLDNDDDDDSIPTNIEAVVITKTTSDILTYLDTDGDQVPNYLDNDEDCDGILTINEDYDGDNNPANDDTNFNGIPDYLENAVANITDISLNVFHIYPNPVKDNITIKFNDLQTTVSMYIYNIQGQKIYSKDKVNQDVIINTSHLSTGVYFINVLSNKQTITKKFIKK